MAVKLFGFWKRFEKALAQRFSCARIKPKNDQLACMYKPKEEINLDDWSSWSRWTHSKTSSGTLISWSCWRHFSTSCSPDIMKLLQRKHGKWSLLMLIYWILLLERPELKNTHSFWLRTAWLLGWKSLTMIPNCRIFSMNFSRCSSRLSNFSAISINIFFSN